MQTHTHTHTHTHTCKHIHTCKHTPVMPFEPGGTLALVNSSALSTGTSKAAPMALFCGWKSRRPLMLDTAD